MPTALATRRLAAIVIADVVGYTRLMERDDSGTFARLGAIRNEVIDPTIVSHGGHIVMFLTRCSPISTSSASSWPCPYLKLAEAYWYEGLRKAGLPER